MQSKKLFTATLLLGLSACGSQTPTSSKLDGHYENSSQTAMQQFANKQTVLPEYQAVNKVMVSLPILTNYGREDLIVEILKSGVNEVIIAVPMNHSGSINSSEFSKLRSMLGPEISKIQLLKMTTSGLTTVWARDWSPQGAYDANGKLVLLDFNYYPNRPADDISTQAMSKFYNYARVSVPVYNEGGNFMSNDDGHCMMTTRVTDANSTQSFAEDMILDAEQVKNYYKIFGGCSEVTIFPRMPNEGTGHIDMWAKFLNNNTLIVSQLRSETLNTITNTNQKQIALKIRDFLEARAAEMQAMGYQVIRIPMPAPELSSSSRAGTVIRSYTNSLTSNGTAILTQYRSNMSSGFASSYTDATLLKSYETEVLAAYQRAGFKTVFIDSDKLISTGGAVHCVTMQYR